MLKFLVFDSVTAKTMIDKLKTAEQINCKTEPDRSQCCSYYEKQIREEKDKIASYEKDLALSNLRLEQLEISLWECQKGKSPTNIPSELRSDELVEFWKDKLLADYRNNAGYIGGIAADLYHAKMNQSQLCHLAAELISLICNEVQENLKVIDVMRNRDGLLTTLGHIKDSIYYHICKQCGIDLSTKSVKERPAAIRAALGRWDVDNSFQESNRIMRHWAALTHIQRSNGGRKSQSPRGNNNKAEALKHYVPGMTAKVFRKELEGKGFIVTETERTLQNWMKEAKAKNENS